MRNPMLVTFAWLICLSWVLPGCPVAGGDGEVRRCSEDGDRVLFCVSGDGCDTEENCADQGMLCVLADGGAECVEPCSNGDTRCSDDRSEVETCGDWNDWTPTGTCDEGQVCQVEEETAQCVEEPCAEGQTRCAESEAKVETCSDDGYWEDTVICDPGQGCNPFGEEATCVDLPCTEGETRCAEGDAEIETCGALGIWSATATCDPDEVCVVQDENAQCVAGEILCTSDTLFAQRCEPDGNVWIQECRNTGTEQSPTYEWVDVQDCSAQSPDYVCIQEPGTFPYCFVE